MAGNGLDVNWSHVLTPFSPSGMPRFVVDVHLHDTPETVRQVERNTVYCPRPPQTLRVHVL